MNNKVLLILGTLVILGILGIFIGKSMGWVGGIKPIDVEIINADTGKSVLSCLKITPQLF